MSGHNNATRLITWMALASLSNVSVVSAGLDPFPGADPDGIFRPDPNALFSIPVRPGGTGEEVYAREGAEIVPWTRGTALPSPDNAAILYYQAFLLCPQTDVATSTSINAVLRDAEPGPLIRAYLGDCRAMIHTAEIAAQVSQCTWGIRYLDTAGFREMSLLGQIRQLATVLALDAHTLAFDRHDEAAFARCRTLRQLARHTGDESMLAYLGALSVDDLAQRTVQYVLGSLPPDADSLDLLRGQLAVAPVVPGSIQKAMQADLNLLVESLRNDTEARERIRQALVRDAADRQTRESAPTMPTEDILALAREPYQRCLNGVFQVMDSDMLYEQKYTEIERRTDELLRDYGTDPAASWIMTYSCVYTDAIVQRYTLSVACAAGYNALKTALEVYLVRAQTGQLPPSLPAYTPKDPYSGQPFEYEVTPAGFILRCRAQDLYENKVLQYEFKIQDKGASNR